MLQSYLHSLVPDGLPWISGLEENRFGKKLRDILDPPRDTGPPKEERREQRLRVVLKGCTYFNNFDELTAWRPSDIDPVQQADIPLLERPAAEVHDQSVPCTEVLLCHDYSGGYHDYESIRPPTLKDEQYSCHYLQHVDVFVNFSYKLVCVPPPTWTNTMHRNGVKILGTFIIEPGTPHHSKDHRSDPIIKSACEYPAGSSLFLKTNLGPAFVLRGEQGNAVCLPFHSWGARPLHPFIRAILFLLSEKFTMQRC